VDGEEEEDSEEGAYKLYKEIVIRRKVVIQGDAVMMPLIDCSASVRAFRVEVNTYIWGLRRKERGNGMKEKIREEAIAMLPVIAGPRALIVMCACA